MNYIPYGRLEIILNSFDGFLQLLQFIYADLDYHILPFNSPRKFRKSHP